MLECGTRMGMLAGQGEKESTRSRPNSGKKIGKRGITTGQTFCVANGVKSLADYEQAQRDYFQVSSSWSSNQKGRQNLSIYAAQRAL